MLRIDQRRSVCCLLVIGLLVTQLLLAPSATAQADSGGGHLTADWTLLDSYPGGSHALTVLASGAIVSLGEDGLYRSDDNGDSWHMLLNPPSGTTIAADPVDTQTVYGYSPAGLSRSADGGASWQVVRPAPAAAPGSGTRVPPFAIAAANHNELFLAERESILSSPDAGVTWQQIYAISHAGSPCVAAITLLVAHPTDPRRLLTDAGCYAGRDLGSALSQTRDGGLTWSTVVRSGPDLEGIEPCGLVGGQGAQPTRWYVTAAAFMNSGGGSVLRSDDDGATWTMVMRAEPGVPALCAMSYDPNQPDAVWVAAGGTSDASLTGVRASADGGQTWSYLGRQDIGWVLGLARASDGSALFAATNEGIWRLLF